MSFYLFVILSVLTLCSAFAVVLAKNPMYSVLSLIVCFFTVAGHYVLLNAQFLAIVHIIVYAGAIMVLFLFVVMLLNLNSETEPHKDNMLKVAAVITGGLLFVVLIASIKATELGTFSLPQKSNLGYVEEVGKKLFTDYLLPFEISSVLFLSAMIGSVVLAKKEK
ncbi:MAG: NADH-quinone oxidoreductase subunit J [Bacteroidia bacterium]|jgi:NADH-quinone oxidoreductase subunit J|nr:NADH-quinone oxidoreductase subunit J [Bacteroidia bacterium]